MAVTLRVQFPSGPLTDPVGGEVTPAWRGFFLSLFNRTGASNGISSDTSDLEAELEAERQARIAGDTELAAAITTAGAAASAALSNEAAIRAAADAAEATARANADGVEMRARVAADALLVPIAQLCSMWAGCNLSFLPTADPGNGKPWLNGTTVTVGTPSGAIVYIGLESGSGDWLLESGAASWAWG